MALFIYTPNAELKAILQEQIQKHRWTDSGFDIPMLKKQVDLACKHTHSFNLEIHVAARMSSTHDVNTMVNAPCLLLPRSSIYKLPFRMCNSIGLIDSGYRGEVQAKVDILKWDDGYIFLDNNVRLFQLCTHNFLPWHAIHIVDSIDDLPSGNDSRGSGGFGSTSLQVEHHPRT